MESASTGDALGSLLGVRAVAVVRERPPLTSLTERDGPVAAPACGVTAAPTDSAVFIMEEA